MGLGKYKDDSAAGRLRNAVLNDRLAHAYILEGDMVTDKLSFAREFAKAILCAEAPGNGCDTCSTCRRIDHGNYEDLYYVSGSDRSVKDEQIASLQCDLMNVPSAEGGRNIAIIEDADTMTVRAQNRFLKTLEEPQPGTVIMLLSENSRMLLPTIRSRCVRVRVGGLRGSSADDRLTALAGELIDMAVRGEYFFNVTSFTDKKIKDKKTALALLDASERIMTADMATDSSTRMNRARILECVGYIEKARRDILVNVNYKYAIRKLMLEIGGQ